MALTLTVDCSMCGEKEPLELSIKGPKELDPKNLKKRIEKEGWIVQFNGDNMDTYCSKKCAE